MLNNNPIVLDDLNRLRAVDSTNLPLGATFIVRVPQPGLPPTSYTLMDSTLAEFSPIIITPSTGGTRRWISHNNLVLRNVDPISPPPFINLEFINTANGNIFVSVGTALVTDWFGVQGMGAGTSSNV